MTAAALGPTLNFPLPEFQFPVRVYIEDTDGGGIVYYVNYLKFMERARTEFLRHLGFEHYLHSSEDFMFVVRSAEARYLAPARMDNALTVTACLQSMGRASLRFYQEVRGQNERGDSVAFATAHIDIACVRRSSLKPRALPERLVALLTSRYGNLSE